MPSVLPEYTSLKLGMDIGIKALLGVVSPYLFPFFSLFIFLSLLFMEERKKLQEVQP